MKHLSLIGVSLMAIGVLIISHASCYEYGKTTGRNESTTLKTEAVFKPRRYFLINWSWNNHIGDFGYSTSNGQYPQRDSVESYIHSAFGEPWCVIHFITEVNETDYNQWCKGHKK